MGLKEEDKNLNIAGLNSDFKFLLDNEAAIFDPPPQK